MRVRELPPLRRHIDVQTPSGRHYRWGQDEPRPENVFGGLRHSSTMPGGYESMDCVLPRKPGVDYSDLERLSTVTVRDPGGGIRGEFRLERAPRVSGDRMSVSPGCVGWQAHLEDDKSAKEVYVDRDLSRWGDPSREALITFWGAAFTCHPGRGVPDPTGGLPALQLGWVGPWAATARPGSQSTYDAGPGLKISALFYDYVVKNLTAAGMRASFRCGANDHGGGVDTGELLDSLAAAGYFTPSTPERFMYAWMQDDTGVAGGTNDTEYTWTIRKVAVYGNHGLTRRGTDPGGFWASDVVAHSVGKCPLLNFTTGPDGTIRPSGFVIPHLAFHDATTRGEMVRQATRYGLQDWAVWDKRTFWWHDRGVNAKRWRARVRPAQLEETGPQVDRLWESVVVEYRDVDGTTKTVGPPGAPVDTTSSFLKDSDPENPANKLGIARRDKLVMGVGTAQSAIEVGRRFLEETGQLDRSGRARIVGWVEDDRGVAHPYDAVRAGDEITFVDASDTSYRRIVKADHDHQARACSVDLDAPPEALDALLDRLSVVLVPLGL